MRTDIRSFLLGGLLVAVIVLGYLNWERQRNTVEIKLPSITIEKH
jgi:regulatory protein YycH of two-component signal transduction system YycFG